MADRLEMTTDLIDYVCQTGTRESTSLEKLRRHTQNLPEADMRVPQEQGQLLHFLIKTLNARKVMELGVFTGYSTLWMASAMPPDGRVIAIDKRKDWQDIAETHWEEAGVRSKIDFRVGRAERTMQELIDDGEAGTFDLIFIDADKKSYTTYYELALRLLRTGGIMVFDNMLRLGDVIDPEVHDPAVDDIRALNARLREDDRVVISMLPFSDGLTLVLKTQ
ncbi:MAG: class I SAM-dependent methyltransferase [Roseibium sp.]|uniref:O-methyltransferase n=1 Tax=Roseibium sp. TaxID=1936156 RepID=UPI001B10753C|nr:class I SAM-dependent methyltransferase [Roseibium sp.]MBO6892340.1 class I SAM-dependent methyltransferase [Roseibium sp.]MBO6929009.1 class I SAM-dependent methyltransferase [Roseibium sp.]